jgi:hypothetical protein
VVTVVGMSFVRESSSWIDDAVKIQKGKKIIKKARDDEDDEASEVRRR